MIEKVLISEDYEDASIRPMVDPDQVEQFMYVEDLMHEMFEIKNICLDSIDGINSLVISSDECYTTEDLEERLKETYPTAKVIQAKEYEKIRHAIMFDTYSRQAFDPCNAEWIYGFEYTDSGERKVFRADNMEKILISEDNLSLSTKEPSDLRIHKVYELDNIKVMCHYVIVEFDDLGSYETARLMTSDGNLIEWLMDYFKPNEDKARRVFSIVRSLKEDDL